MYLLNIEDKTIQECTILEKKPSYTIIQIGNEIFGLPVEDERYYLCNTYEQACRMCCGTFIPQ